MQLPFVFHDGGRKAAGFKGGPTGDCVARAIAIAADLPYREVYNRLAAETGRQRPSRRTPCRGASARQGINVNRCWFRKYMRGLGFVWYPTMGIGTGCTVHMRRDELPTGRLVVSLSQHYAAVVEGFVFDTVNPCRRGERCVYGYWRLER